MRLAASVFNHLLAQNAWATHRLARVAGQSFRIVTPPLALTFTIDEQGLVYAAAGSAAQATLTLTPDALLRYLATTPRDADLIRIEGDAAFGAELRAIFSQLSWEAEEDLSRFFGDVIAHRLAGTARDLWAWRKQTALNFAHAAAEYLTEEQPLIAKPRHLKTFAQDVDTLHNAVMALEQRIGKLNADRATQAMK